MGKSKIEWLDGGSSWNPLAGCTKASSGCENCYALRMSRRQEGIGLCKRYQGTTTQKGGKLAWTGEVNFDEQELLKPLSWKKPRRIFVCSMSDLFHPAVKTEWIHRIYDVMKQCPQHTFIVLTKRPKRIVPVLYDSDGVFCCEETGNAAYVSNCTFLPNVQHLVSVENQETLWRIEALLKLRSEGSPGWPVLGVSAEPLLGPVDFSPYLDPTGQVSCINCGADERNYLTQDEQDALKFAGGDALCPECGEMRGLHGYDPGLDWVIAGGESGPGARPMHPEWARRIRDDCKAAGVPYFHKQNGAWQECSSSGWYTPQELDRQIQVGNCRMMRVGKKAAGHLLDGREIHEWPGGEDG